MKKFVLWLTSLVYLAATPAFAEVATPTTNPCSGASTDRTLTLAGSSTDTARGPDWSSVSLDYSAPTQWCQGRILTGLSQDTRGDDAATILSVGALGTVASGMTWEVHARAAVDAADFSARHGGSASIGVPFRFETGPLGGLVLSGTASYTGYKDVDLYGIGIGAEIYPARSNMWLTFNATQFETDGESLPIGFRARLDWPVTESLRLFGWTGLGYEDIGTGLEEVQTSIVGARQSVGEALHIQVTLGQDDREFAGQSETIGLALTRTF